MLETTLGDFDFEAGKTLVKILSKDSKNAAKAGAFFFCLLPWHQTNNNSD